jgi:V/A-type H+-transporting ATPase subunit B
MTDLGLEYKGVASISGPIIIVENVRNVGYDELVAVKTQTGETRLGKVVEVTKKAVTVQVFEGTTGLTFRNTYTFSR